MPHDVDGGRDGSDAAIKPPKAKDCQQTTGSWKRQEWILLYRGERSLPLWTDTLILDLYPLEL